MFVAGDLLWYPVEHDRRVRTAPGALVVFGRPKGHQGSDAQFIEGGVAPQVVFEVLSPKNSGPAMARKRAFYEQYGGGSTTSTTHSVAGGVAGCAVARGWRPSRRCSGG